ncbi:MAG: zinc ribbon domain-containing protein [Rhodospirillales bacterium]|nr:zinc ribbon domain-containing protein [Rhodospirillales bacterium]
MTSRSRRKSKDRVKATGGPACPSCGAAAVAGARFCHACGASLEAGSGGGKWSAGLLTGLAAAAVFIAVAVFGMVMYSERASDPSSSLAATAPVLDAPAATSPGGLPDLSRLTPREAADRLFNRVMMASEQGDRAEALRFVPMAVEAYEGLPTLDRDAHYHLGLIHGVAGDRAEVERQIAAMRQGAPDHLLALVLEHRGAERSGDSAAVSRVLAAFAAAYDAEIAKRRPEYEAHSNTIEDLRAAAAAAAASAPEPAGTEPAGAAQ